MDHRTANSAVQILDQLLVRSIKGVGKTHDGCPYLNLIAIICTQIGRYYYLTLGVGADDGSHNSNLAGE